MRNDQRTQEHSQPVAQVSLVEYFSQRLASYASQLTPRPQEDTCWYLGNLLDRFVRSDSLFAYSEGRLRLRPLALLYDDALRAGDDRTRCLYLQHLGDLALFLGALYPENYARRGIRQDYFVGMGGGAYDYLASHARHNRHVFAELAATFTRMLAMVADAGSRASGFDSQDIIALYGRWLQSGDPLVARQLQALGVSVANSEARH
ncbi:MAG: hypothetical protein AAF648_09695 [Pseudomonadota bacterium]